ncbi:helix-turn-helix domain-containing protein [Marinifilum sp. RC60d5]|uniref:helix-turn-helix domain-containing protein n=1 Tax=Marinifilum sp. RC60d5 TaxID=3458414 RepID=UPI0040352527
MTEKILQVSEMSSADIIKQFTAMNKKLAELAEYVKPNNSATLLSPKEVMEWLSITPPTLNDWAKKGILNRYKLGNRAFYKKEEIMANLDGTKYADKL